MSVRSCPLRALLLTLILQAIATGRGAGQPLGHWTEASLDSLAQSWPGNAIENLPPGPELGYIPEGRLVVVQLGDSHVQGDMACVATRNGLASLLGLGTVPRGYAFPFGAARSNEPRDISSRPALGWRASLATRERGERAYGLASAALSVQPGAASLTIGLRPERTAAAPATEVSFLFEPRSDSLAPWVNGAPPSRLDLARGLATYSFETPPSALRIWLKSQLRLDPPFRFLGMVLDAPGSDLIFHGGGLNGADVRTLLANTRLGELLQILEPGVVILSIGTNDAYNSNFSPERFYQGLRELSARIAHAVPGVLLVLATPNDHFFRRERVNPRVEEAALVIRRLAREEGYGLWDFHRIMGGPGSSMSWFNQGLMAQDLLHFSPAGYLLQGRMLAYALYRALALENWRSQAR